MNTALDWLHPIFDPQAAISDLSRLMVTGVIDDPELQRRRTDLSRYFLSYVNFCPVPFWAPGLIVTNETSRMSETFFPFAVIQGAFQRLVRLSLRQGREIIPPLFQQSSSWLDLLHRLQGGFVRTDPAAVLGVLMGNELERQRFLFSIYLPQQFGGGFGRYPKQYAFLRQWLRARGVSGGGQLRCLDAACGSGEGTYELARLVKDAGVPAGAVSISGVTLSPLEVFAASHACFPHDHDHERLVRSFLGSVNDGHSWGEIRFAATDLRTWEPPELFHVILCNGVLGGPMLHYDDALKDVVRRLARSLERGGILLAADRFHAGWRKVVPATQLESLFCAEGLSLVQVGEGIGGIKPSGG